MSKAKFIEFEFRDSDGNAVLLYEYRGHRYEIIDYGWKQMTPTSWQHRNKQNEIDALIEEENKPREKRPVKYEDTAEAGLDAFLSYYNE